MLQKECPVPTPKNPAVAARRAIVGLLLMNGFTAKMVCDATGQKKATVNNDKVACQFKAPENPFALRMALWLHWKREGTLGADLEARIASDAELRTRIIAVLTQGVMAELNPAVVPLLRGILPVLEDDSSYEWLFTGPPMRLVPPVEQLWAAALNAGNRAPPATLEEAVFLFTQYMTVKYVQPLALATPGDEDRTVRVRTPAHVRAAIDALRRDDAYVWHMWDRWLWSHQGLGELSPSQRNHGRNLRLVREERRLRLQILDACTKASSEIAAFRTWLELGPERVATRLQHLDGEVTRLKDQENRLFAALLAANERLEAAGLTPVSQDAIPEPEIPEAWWMRVDELGLSVRSANCLQNSSIEYVWQLIEKSEAEMLKTKFFGRKSLNEIKELLVELGLSLGTRISPAQGRALKHRSGIED